jgi:alpha-L-fucosidase
VDDYDPDFVYTDGTEPFTGRGTAKGVISDATVKLVAHMYNRRAARNGGVVDCMAVIKGGPRITGVASPREGGYLGPILRTPWVWENTCGEWFFEDHTFYSPRAMVLQMIEAICRDGNYNLNIGLTPEGALEPGGEQMWREFGAFLKINGAAVYGSRAWKVLGEGREQADPRKPGSPPALVCFPQGEILPRHDAFPMTMQDIRFTEGRDGSVYAFVMAVPKPGVRVVIKSLGTAAKLLEKPVRSVVLLGSSSPLAWQQTPDALMVTCPGELRFQHAVVFKVETGE